MRALKVLFPGPAGVPAWHRRTLRGGSFPYDTSSPCAAFFRPAAAACRRRVAAEKLLPASASGGLPDRMRISLRLWREAQRLTLRLAREWKPVAGMDLPMTLNYAMALGNYAREFLFSAAGPLPPGPALLVHAAFAREMVLMPALMTLPARARAGAWAFPDASAQRLARAFAEALRGAE